MTDPLFRENAYVTTCDARVLEITEQGGIVLDRTVFYAASGGQPGDTGRLVMADGSAITIADTVFDDDRTTIIHVPDAGQTLPPVGSALAPELDWERRHKLMRMHTALHIICAVLKTKITGCQIGEEESRIDLNIPEPPEREAVQELIQQAIGRDMPTSTEWITDAELDANPDLIKSMSVSPPRGSGRVRLVRIGDDFDLQPCGGTHVASTSEIGAIDVTKIENKGKLNRRIRIRFAS
ncbi:alanyl-tRNA editing protein [Roseibium litorale]|uniref:Alanine--tRNA ligase n=1 Tax=Roseibium litorale TaxID=2803841 RepID=A0ABR9CG94_9HYPH|nr:alanyl-tRNA editing protein [Roseibium litorale]MBD8889936.1 alanyl-tRNA editing protein [Roseibium litorale]